MSHIENRRASVVDWHAARALDQGYTPSEARRRAAAQQSLDEAFTDRQLTVAQGLTASGWEPADWRRISDGTMPTYELTGLVGYAECLPRLGEPPRDPGSYTRYDLTPGPHGLY